MNAKDLAAVSGFATCAIHKPGEFMSSVGPTLNEATFGLLGSSFRPKRDIPDLTGKVIFVTGGNTGLGRETVLQLARHNPSRIYLAARNAEKARNAIAGIKRELSSPVDLRHILLDLSSFRSIRAAAERFTVECDRLDILVLNAGIMGNPPARTKEGFEIQFGTNHIGHFLLAKLLLPTLQKTVASANPAPDVRVVTVASMANELCPSYEIMTSSDKLLSASTWTRYGASKAANILFAAELARRYPEIISVSVHPGVVASNLYETTKSTGATMACGIAAMSLFFRSVRTGALNQIWAAAGAKRGQLVNGAYYTPIGRRSTTNKHPKNAEMARRLWEWTEAEIAKHPA